MKRESHLEIAGSVIFLALMGAMVWLACAM